MVGHTPPDGLALVLALDVAELEAVADGELAAAEALGRGAIVANDDGLEVAEGAAHAAVASAAAAKVTRPARAPTLNLGERKSMNNLLHGCLDPRGANV
jgi:hypothetical protein